MPMLTEDQLRSLYRFIEENVGYLEGKDRDLSRFGFLVYSFLSSSLPDPLCSAMIDPDYLHWQDTIKAYQEYDEYEKTLLRRKQLFSRFQGRTPSISIPKRNPTVREYLNFKSLIIRNSSTAKRSAFQNFSFSGFCSLLIWLILFIPLYLRQLTLARPPQPVLTVLEDEEISNASSNVASSSHAQSSNPSGSASSKAPSKTKKKAKRVLVLSTAQNYSLDRRISQSDASSSSNRTRDKRKNALGGVKAKQEAIEEAERLKRKEMELPRQEKAVQEYRAWCERARIQEKEKRENEIRQLALKDERRRFFDSEFEKLLSASVVVEGDDGGVKDQDGNDLKEKVEANGEKVEVEGGKLKKIEVDENLKEYLAEVYSRSSSMIIWNKADLLSFPPIYGLFDSVQEVNLSENSLIVIPSALFELTNLRRLYLHHNRIKMLPTELRCSTLQCLDLHANHLRILPDLSGLNSLQMLDCEKNQIRDFPKGIEQCEHLYHLNLKSNQIRIIPRELGQFLNEGRKLAFLNLRNNPIVNLPPHIYQQGTKATLQFLSDPSGSSFVFRPNNTPPIVCDLSLLLYALIPSLPKIDIAQNLKSSQTPQFPPFLLCDIALRSTIDYSEFPCHRSIVWARCPLMRPSLNITKPKRNNFLSETSDLPRIPIHASSEHIQILIAYWYADSFIAKPIEPVLVSQGLARQEIDEIISINAQLDQTRALTLQANIQMALNYGHPYLARLMKNGNQKDWSKSGKSSDGNDSHVSSFYDDMKGLMNSKDEHDVYFNAPGRDPSFLESGNRILLASRAPFLKALFTSGMTESQNLVICLGDVSPNVVRAVLEFCYTDDVENLDSETIIELLCTSKLYGLERLQSMLESIVGYSLDFENVTSLIVLAADEELKGLASACKFFILSNWQIITSQKEWNQVPQSIRNSLSSTAKKWGII